MGIRWKRTARKQGKENPKLHHVSRQGAIARTTEPGNGRWLQKNTPGATDDTIEHLENPNQEHRYRETRRTNMDSAG